MYLDGHLVFSSEQTLTPIAAGSEPSDNIIDFGGLAAADGGVADGTGVLPLGGGEPIKVVIRLIDAVTTGGTTYVQFQLETDDAIALGTNNVVISQTAAIGTATLIAGYEVTLSFVPDQCKRYLRVNYVISGNDTTAGSVDAFLVVDAQAGETVN